MGNSTFFEMDHDRIGAIQADPLRFAQVMASYGNSADTETASELEHRFGVKVWRFDNRNGDWEVKARNAIAPPSVTKE